jgi:hypothetical protein
MSGHGFQVQGPHTITKSSTSPSTAGDSFTSRIAVLAALLSTVGWRLRRNRRRSAGRNGGLSASLIDQHRRGRREPAISTLPHPQFEKTRPDNRKLPAALTLLSGCCPLILLSS